MTDFPLTIESQEEFDQHIARRLERAKKEAERSVGLDELREQLAEAEAARDAAVENAHQRLVHRDAVTLLSGMNVDGGRQERLLKILDLEGIPTDAAGDPDHKTLERRVKALYADTPEIFGEGAQVEERGLDSSATDGAGTDTALSAEHLSTMTPEQINQNWSTIRERLPQWLGGAR